MEKSTNDTWLKKMRLRAEKSQSDVAENLRISQSQYSRYEISPGSLPFSLIQSLSIYLQFDLSEIEEGERSLEKIDPGNPYKKQRDQLLFLNDFIRDSGDANSSSKKAESMGVDVPTIADLKRAIGKYDYKPNIVLAGRFDSGKSYLANQILGGEFLPSRHQPTTRLLSIIRDDAERPSWQEQPVSFLGKDFWKSEDGYHYDLSYLADKDRVLKHRKHEGSLHSLNEHGVYWFGRKSKLQKQVEKLEVHTAVIYIKSPLLRSCNIIDTPGFEDRSDPALQEERFQPIKDLMDVLVYTSTTNGFMDARDQAYLKYLISLSNKGFERFPKHPTMGNVFVVCTLASPDLIDDATLKSTLDIGSERLAAQIQESVLKDLRASTRRQYSTKVLNSRFFPFWAQSVRRHERLRNELISYLSQVLPSTYLSNFEADLNKFKTNASDRISQAIGYYQKVRDDVEGARVKYQTIMEYAPKREIEINREIRSLRVFIRSLKSSDKDSLRTLSKNLLTVSALRKIIAEEYGSRKQEAKNNAPLLVFSKLEAAAKDMVGNDYEQKFRPQLESFAKLYSSLSFDPEISKPGSVNIPFNFRRLFIDAFVGGSAIYIGSTFGPIGLAVGLGIAFFGWVINRQSWQERLSKQIIKSFDENSCVVKLEDGIEQFWNNVEESFDELVKRAEADWERSVRELRAMVDVDSMTKAERNIKHLEKLKLFFDQVHWSPME